MGDPATNGAGGEGPAIVVGTTRPRRLHTGAHVGAESRGSHVRWRDRRDDGGICPLVAGSGHGPLRCTQHHSRPAGDMGCSDIVSGGWSIPGPEDPRTPTRVSVSADRDSHRALTALADSTPGETPCSRDPHRTDRAATGGPSSYWSRGREFRHPEALAGGRTSLRALPRARHQQPQLRPSKRAEPHSNQPMPKAPY